MRYASAQSIAPGRYLPGNRAVYFEMRPPLASRTDFKVSSMSSAVSNPWHCHWLVSRWERRWRDWRGPYVDGISETKSHGNLARCRESEHSSSIGAPTAPKDAEMMRKMCAAPVYGDPFLPEEDSPYLEVRFAQRDLRRAQLCQGKRRRRIPSTSVNRKQS